MCAERLCFLTREAQCGTCMASLLNASCHDGRAFHKSDSWGFASARSCESWRYTV